MNNRLNFKAWHEKSKRMGQVTTLTQSWQTPLTLVKFDGCDISEAILTEELIILQCMGKEDKTGKLIFEGNILRVFDWGRRSAELGVTSVVWCEDDKGWRYADAEITEDAYDQFRNVEIIGNIYQDPELMERNND